MLAVNRCVILSSVLTLLLFNSQCANQQNSLVLTMNDGKTSAKPLPVSPLPQVPNTPPSGAQSIVPTTHSDYKATYAYQANALPETPSSNPPKATIFPPICGRKTLSDDFLEKYLGLHCPAQREALLQVLRLNADMYEAAHIPTFLPILCRWWESDQEAVRALGASTITQVYRTLMAHSLKNSCVEEDRESLCTMLSCYMLPDLIRQRSHRTTVTNFSESLAEKYEELFDEHSCEDTKQVLKKLSQDLPNATSIKQYLMGRAFAMQIIESGAPNLKILKDVLESRDDVRLVAFLAGEVYLRAQDKLAGVEKVLEAITKAIDGEDPKTKAWRGYLRLVCINECIGLEQQNPAAIQMLLERFRCYGIIYYLAADDWNDVLRGPVFADKQRAQALASLFSSIQYVLVNSPFVGFLQGRLDAKECGIPGCTLGEVHLNAIKALGELVKLKLPPIYLEEALHTLIAKVCEGKDAKMCGAAATALSHLLSVAPEKASIMLERFNKAYQACDELNPRICIIHTLGKLAWLLDQLSIQRLFTLLTAQVYDDNPSIRKNAVLALSKVSSAQPAYRLAICELFGIVLDKEQDPKVRQVIVSFNIECLAQLYANLPMHRATLFPRIKAICNQKQFVMVEKDPGVTVCMLYSNDKLQAKLGRLPEADTLWEMPTEAAQALRKQLLNHTKKY